MSILGSILEPVWEPAPPLYSFWMGLRSFLAEKNGVWNTIRFLMPTFSHQGSKMASLSGRLPATCWHLFGDFCTISPRGSQNPPKSLKTKQEKLTGFVTDVVSRNCICFCFSGWLSLPLLPPLLLHFCPLSGLSAFISAGNSTCL